MHVEQNRFDNVHTAIEAATSYFNATRTITLDAKNNLVVGATTAIVVSEGGTGNTIDATLAFNTLASFGTGVTVFNNLGVARLLGNVLDTGSVGVSGSGTYTTEYDLAHAVDSDFENGEPTSGAFTAGDPAFVDAAQGDYHLGAASDAVDVVPSGYPEVDLDGCGRPRGTAADVGALER